MKVLKNLEKFNECKRSNLDRRKKISWAVFSYIDQNTGYEYRKSFEAQAYTSESEFWKLAPKSI